MKKTKLSNKTFYKRHNLELERYLNNTNTLHIINLDSKEKVLEDKSRKLYIDFRLKKNNPFQSIDEIYDCIILTDVLEESEDIYNLLSNLSKLLSTNGKIVISSTNMKWQWIFKIFEFLKLKDFSNRTSFFYDKKLNSIINGLGFETISYISRQFFPFKLFFVGSFINKFFESVFFFTNFGIKTYLVIRKITPSGIENLKTIIIPAKNEEGNINNLIDRIPNKEKYEIIISCGKSTDNTTEVAKERAKSDKNFNIKVIEQSKNGKANAVWEGLDIATGDLIAILDSDISVDPETIPDFFSIIEEGRADFVNGTRLIYEMESGSMRKINHLGNKFFQSIISFIIKKPLTDTLCGTKVFKKELINKIYWWQKEFKLNDPFCDFDLIFSASYFNDKIIEYPVHYRARTYGATQISRFRDGYKLIKYLVRSYFIFNSSREK